MLKLILLTLFVSFLIGCKTGDKTTPENNNQQMETNTSQEGILGSDTSLKTDKQYAPFEITEYGGKYNIAAFIESKENMQKYFGLFEKHGYSGNGVSWEGHIRQILKKLEPSLLSNIRFDVEGGAFFAVADSKASQIRFVELLSPIFSDTKKLEEWIKKADRSQIEE